MAMHPSSFRQTNKASLVQYEGVFRERMSLIEGAALITSGTIGAGVLGIPFVVATVGVWIGMVYIITLGCLMMGLNLLIGELAIRTGEPLQLVGLARRYLGPWGARLMTVLMYALLFGVLNVYIIGEGETLAALFGGSSFAWSLGFFVVVTCLIALGMRTVKTIEVALSFGILFVLLAIIFFSTPHITLPYWQHSDITLLLFPYGVLLFAFHGTTAIPEAHALLRNRDTAFRKAIIMASTICMIVYALFALVVVGVTGPETTEIATIGLGYALGPAVLIFGNVFAALAMGTGFLMAGLALRDSLQWDMKLGAKPATMLATGVPLLLFLLGIRQFIATIDLVGGIVMSMEMLLILLIYWKAKQRKTVAPGPVMLRHTPLLIAALILAFSVGIVYSFMKLF